MWEAVQMVEGINTLVSVVIPTLIGIGVSWGWMSTRVNHLETVINELKQEVKDFRRLSEDLAVVKHEITSIKDMVALIIKDKQ